jgi:hypothetical protein
MNLRYANFSLAKGLLNYMLGNVLPTLADAFSRSLPAQNPVWRLLDRCLVALRLVELLYFFYFLNRGGAARVVEKLLGLRVVYAQRPSFGL